MGDVSPPDEQPPSFPGQDEEEDKEKGAEVGHEKPKEPEKAEKEGPPLPPLTAAEFRQYNYLAEHMEQFHNSFRLQWRLLEGACTAQQLPPRTTVRQLLTQGLRFASQLEMHHAIEEAHVFPSLAKRMPCFGKGAEHGAMIAQHKLIHTGLDEMRKYLEECRDGRCRLEWLVLDTKMRAFGDVLWKHLEEEVTMLKAENMRKFWTTEEMKGLAF
ncbi:hypothetical protein BZA05DRAFT_446682 [Tricharina praecox]|uniref:uncharacterized protein n=1 Tax=Tricharina praecox TaxID=43433 RepID=UPI00221F07F9|nr:uncharacterized protein BZA05DRAFT_446682 [Tricharina praecox]KAI5848391.1 hypothetical protein BZA05DRAFT_446682 [Tricharina praecox]